MATKTDLQTNWPNWTGDALRETRHRIRMLSEDGLLPARSTELTYEDGARAVLGFLASETHKDAPLAVREFSEFRCVSVSDGPNAFDLLNKTLIEGIILGLTSHVPMQVEVCITERWSKLTINHGGTFVIDDSGLTIRGGAAIVYHFMESHNLDFGPKVYPIVVSRTIRSPLILKLSELINDQPGFGSANPEKTKAAGAATPATLTATQAPTQAPASPSRMQHRIQKEDLPRFDPEVCRHLKD
jgi:hypothetical protein